MKLVANTINGEYLRDILPGPEVEVDGVLAAIAYGQDGNNPREDFIGHCVTNKYRLDIWMRYDHTVPVGVSMLRRLLQHHKDNVFCKLIPDYLHAKVIWWRGYGAYIGSANLTDRAWITNIEAGVFLTEDDLHENNMAAELEKFFDGLRAIDQARPLTQEIVDEMEALTAEKTAWQNKARPLRKEIPEWNGPAWGSKAAAEDRRKENFRKEWQETLTILRSIGDQITEYRPHWIEPDIPAAWQADQFLHAYYYRYINEGQRIPYEEEYQKNRGNPQAALENGMQWWKSTQEPPSIEDRTIYEWAPSLQYHLAGDRILGLGGVEFAEVCGHTHATLDHISKMQLARMGRPDLKTLELEKRVPVFAEWLLKQRNAKGWSVLQLINYVLYGGNDADIWERLYTAARNADYALPHYGLNSMAELVGWVRPEVVPPRNGRTSKSLRSLGYDVELY